MRKVMLLSTPAIALAFGALALPHASFGYPSAPAFTEIDTDGDGMITQDEFRAFMGQRRLRIRGEEGHVDPFTRADADMDGVLNEEEFDKLMQSRGGPGKRLAIMHPSDLFERSDADGNGLLEQGEFEAMMENLPPAALPGEPAELFTQSDTDADGALDPEEFQSLMERIGKVRVRFGPSLE